MKIGIAGGTGLIGKEVVLLLSKSNDVEKTFSFQRKARGVPFAKMDEIVKKFDDINESDIPEELDAFICCLGTTIKKAKSKQNFKKVDAEYVLKFAKLAYNKGCKHFLVVSAVGADKNSAFFYSRVKGEMEEELKAIPFERIDIFRPSLLLGSRNEFRLGEKIGAIFFVLLNVFMIGSFANYAAIKSSTVAKAIFNNIREKSPGVHVHFTREMKFG